MLFQPFQLDGICMTKMINQSRFSLNKTREIEINLKRLSSMEQDLSVVELLYFSKKKNMKKLLASDWLKTSKFFHIL